MERNIRNKAEALDNVNFTGFVPPDEIHEYYRRASLLVCTSEYEDFPNTFLEAWRYATPVVTLKPVFEIDSPGPPILVESGTISQLVDDVADLQNDTNKRKQMGETARSVVRERFSIDAVTSELLNSIEKTL